MDPVNDFGCQYVEEHDLVSAYLGGRLSEQEAEAFERHYFGCERCWGEVKAGEEIRAALKRAGLGGGGEAPGPWTTCAFWPSPRPSESRRRACLLRPGATGDPGSTLWQWPAPRPRQLTTFQRGHHRGGESQQPSSTRDAGRPGAGREGGLGAKPPYRRAGLPARQRHEGKPASRRRRRRRPGMESF